MSVMEDKFSIGDVVQVMRSNNGEFNGKCGLIIGFNDFHQAEVRVEGIKRNLIFRLPSSIMKIDDAVICPCDRPFDYECFSCIEMMYP